MKVQNVNEWPDNMNDIIKIRLFNILSELLIGLMAHHCKMDCLVKRLDCFVVVKVKVTQKVQNSSECELGR